MPWAWHEFWGAMGVTFVTYDMGVMGRGRLQGPWVACLLHCVNCAAAQFSKLENAENGKIQFSKLENTENEEIRKCRKRRNPKVNEQFTSLEEISRKQDPGRALSDARGT